MTKTAGSRKKANALLDNLQWVGLVLVLFWLSRQVTLVFSAPNTAIAASKPFGSFEQFYPFYLSQHADLTCRRLHFVGTSLILLYAMADPMLFPSLILGALMGYAVFPMTRSFEHGIIEMVVMFSVFVLSVRRFSGSWYKGALVLTCAYGFAWAGHFIFEHNRPATFIYPLFSLFGDFRMWWEIVTGMIPF